MFILPWLQREAKSPMGTTSRAFQFFLDKGGTQLLSIEPAQELAFLSENGLVSENSFTADSIRFVKINREKTDLSAFYSFNEEDVKGLEVWRTFLWIGEGPADDPWGTNKALEKISLSNFQVAALIQTILRQASLSS